MKEFFKQVLEARGKIVVNQTSTFKIESLIDSLHPINCGSELMRIGPKSDGGYLVPNDLEGIAACFSPGVDEISDFELACYHRGMQVYLADRSVSTPNLPLPKNKYHFLKKHIGCFSNCDCITIDDWVNKYEPEPDKELLLQMDIEGCEYISIVNMSDQLLKRFRILVIEFHFLDELWNPRFFDLAENTFNKVLHNHSCVHIHPNNCCGMSEHKGIKIPRMAEFTFIRNDRVDFQGYRFDFPHSLDYDNTRKKSLHLPSNWYRKYFC
jgi:hypothetical protein